MMMRAFSVFLITTSFVIAQEAEYRAIFGEKEVVTGVKLSGWDRVDNPPDLDTVALLSDAKKIRYFEKLGALSSQTTAFLQFHNHG